MQMHEATSDDAHLHWLLCCVCGCWCSEAHDWQPLPAPMAMSSAAGSRSPSCAAFIRRMAPTQELQQQDWPAGLSRRLDSTGLQWRENSRRSMVGFPLPCCWYSSVGDVDMRWLQVTASAAWCCGLWWCWTQLHHYVLSLDDCSADKNAFWTTADLLWLFVCLVDVYRATGLPRQACCGRSPAVMPS
jgi:hypothetical protein